MVSKGDAQRFAHRANLTRYRKMLAGHLTPVERVFIERRMEEEQQGLRKLAESSRPEVHTQ